MAEKCVVCGREPARWPTIDYATGFTFCDEHYHLAKDMLEKYPEKTMANWLRAIADAMDKVMGLELLFPPPQRSPAEEERTKDILRHAEAGIFRCRFCGAPYAYRENLDLHEQGCPKR